MIANKGSMLLCSINCCLILFFMPRPIRIEYENSFYHVMNRGRGRQTIFHDHACFQLLLERLIHDANACLDDKKSSVNTEKLKNLY